MKKLVLVLSLIFCSMASQAQIVLEGAAEYNVQSALEEVQETVEHKINPCLFSPHLLDPNRDENLGYILKGQLELKDRTLAVFSVGSYGVVYNNDKKHAYYYYPNGALKAVDVRTGGEYPYKSYQYDTMGNLINMGLRLSKGETYLYDAKGKLIAHWVGANGYDEKGNLVMTRIFKE